MPKTKVNKDKNKAMDVNNTKIINTNYEIIPPEQKVPPRWNVTFFKIC